MMKQSSNGCDPESFHRFNSLCDPGPLPFCRIFGTDFFPKKRRAKCFYSKPGEKIEVTQPLFVTVEFELVEINIPNPVHGTFNTAPNFNAREASRGHCSVLSAILVLSQ